MKSVYVFFLFSFLLCFSPMQARLIRDAYGKGNYVTLFNEANLDTESVHTVLELGSRDAVDALEMNHVFGAHVYAFECNPTGLTICRHNIDGNPNVTLIPFAAWDETGMIPFQHVVQSNGASRNIGASSCFKVLPDGADRTQIQQEISVPAIRMDEWIDAVGIEEIDLLCMDTQGATLRILKGFGDKLYNVKTVITEVYYQPSYAGEALYSEIADYLEKYGFYQFQKPGEIPTSSFGDALFTRD